MNLVYEHTNIIDQKYRTQFFLDILNLSLKSL